MAKHRPLEAGVEDGSWFLEAVGAQPPPAGASESLSELQCENAEPETFVANVEPESSTGGSVDVPDTTYLDGDPGTSTSSFDPIPDIPQTPEGLEPNQNFPVGASAHSSASELDDTLLAPALQTKRRFRWPTIALVVFLVALLAAAIFWLPKVQEQQAFAVRQNNYDAAYNIRTHLPASQTALDSITNPNSSESEIAAVIPIVASLSNRGAALADAATQRLPATVPFLAPPSMENLDTFTEQSTFLAADTSEIARRLNRGYVYRTSMPKLLVTGALPTAASANEIAALSVTLASSLADAAAVVSELPNDPAFAATLTVVSSTLDLYREWQDDYLNALTAQDADSASDLLGALEVLRSDILAATTSDLLLFRIEIDSRIVDLASSLDNHLENLSR
ncbi:MAG: hypothetical protein ACC654_06500 [Acidimicrobiia bacterium]